MAHFRSKIRNVCSRRFCSLVSTAVVTMPRTSPSGARSASIPEIEPLILPFPGNAGDADFEAAGSGSESTACLAATTVAATFGGRKSESDLPIMLLGGPCARHVLRPDHAQVGMLIEDGHGGVAECPQRSEGGLRFQFRGRLAGASALRLLLSPPDADFMTWIRVGIGSNYLSGGAICLPTRLKTGPPDSAPLESSARRQLETD